MHDSGLRHVSGSAVYTDDIPEPAGTLIAYVRYADKAYARIKHTDTSAVAAHPGVAAVITATEIPGINNIGPVFPDEPLLAEGFAEYYGHPLFAVAACDLKTAREASAKARIEWEVLEPELSVRSAYEKQQFVAPVKQMKRGDADKGLTDAPHRLKKNYRVGGQDHFYLEGQVSLSVPGEDGEITIYVSTQHPSEVQHMAAKVLGVSHHKVIVEVRRMGGGFGGKETQAAALACISAVLAVKTGKPVKLRYDRDDDMIITGKRHDFEATAEAGYDDNGRISALRTLLLANAGWSADLSLPVCSRAMFHTDNAYYIEHLKVTGCCCKTNTVSNTAFRGFGGPQGMFFTEQVIDDVARRLGKDPADVRKLNYYDKDTRNITHYGQPVSDFELNDMTRMLEQSSDYYTRREEIKIYNGQNEIFRRGLALTPVKFGISFTVKSYNQAGALINIYPDGTVQLNHGGTEMGQGLFIKTAQVAADVLGIDPAQIRCMATNTGKVPNTSATAASSGTDLTEWPVSLSATGFYRTPDLNYNEETATGSPFYYFAYGAAATEVIIDSLTGEYKLLRADILHDCGNSLNEAIDRGQIEGGYIQGVGWLTSEELVWNKEGRLLTHAPSTYKIPTCRDIPPIFNVDFYHKPNAKDTIFKSKAVGEPPFMLGMSAFFALKDAVGSFAAPGEDVILDAPATPERVLMEIERLKSVHQNALKPAELYRLYTGAEPFITVTVIETSGSAPCRAGAKMAVGQTGRLAGSVGGGRLEHSAVQHSIDMLKRCDVNLHTEEFSLGASLGQCCGGRVRLLYEPVNIFQHKLALFGSGHIAKEIISVLAGTSVRLTVIDNRPTEFPTELPSNCRTLLTEDPVAEMPVLKDCDAALIMTHDHSLDFDIVYDALKESRFDFLGLIGSAKKRQRFEYLLRGRGIADEDIARLICPSALKAYAPQNPERLPLQYPHRYCNILSQTKFSHNR
ncbi:hypothetical protein CHS0354_006880 [Potamilus streckersoni]|uniref:Aldehyde oxidase/xanthine dehydrogenase a/b hammerhead domain-containing protein n=1 Tax=Potamilus streckersoni TaxID=2493646 RepID=A0AAE0TF48_9BIVA|nr:hypothetical protein CHS0354_006880 [Potamilus streckersoni]